MTRFPYLPRRLLIAPLAAMLLAACQPAASVAPPAGAVPVEVATVLSATLSGTDEFSGRLQAPETVRLTPRVSGFLQAVHFTEGSTVKAGDLLFSLDDAPLRAEVNRLTASLQEVQSAAALAQRDYERALTLKKQNAIANEVLDNRQSKQEQLKSQVAAIRAALQKAELDLSYTRIHAPIDGVVSNAFVTAGNYVHAGQTMLTSLVSSGKVYAWVDADEQSLLRYLTKQDGLSGRQAQPVLLALSDNSDFNYKGELDFIDNQLNSQTGTIRLRATFDNSDGRLLPGLFVRLRLPADNAKPTVLISDKAIGTDLASRYVLVVDEQHALQYRPVQLGERIGSLRVIKQGLAEGDQVVVNGLQRVRPGVIIEPKPVEMADSVQLKLLSQAQHAFSQQLTAASSSSNAAASASQASLQ